MSFNLDEWLESQRDTMCPKEQWWWFVKNGSEKDD